VIGGGIAAAAVVGTVATLDNTRGGGAQLIRLTAPAEGIGLGDWRLWLVLAVMTALAGIVAAAGARVTVRRRLARLP
jgi:hypothetical protein